VSYIYPLQLLFSLLLTTRILAGKNQIDQAEWYFLLTGGVSMDNPHDNSASEWLSDKQWGEVCRLSHLEAFKGMHDDFHSLATQWRAIYDHTDPHLQPLPGHWDAKLKGIKRLCALRCIRPDKVVLAVQNFVAEVGKAVRQACERSQPLSS